MIKKIFLVCFCLLSLFLRMTAQTDSVFLQERVFIAPTNTCFNKGDVVQVIGQVLSSEKTLFVHIANMFMWKCSILKTV